jgi:hypothetical protein
VNTVAASTGYGATKPSARMNTAIPNATTSATIGSRTHQRIRRFGSSGTHSPTSPSNWSSETCSERDSFGRRRRLPPPVPPLPPLTAPGPFAR